MNCYRTLGDSSCMSEKTSGVYFMINNLVFFPKKSNQPHFMFMTTEILEHLTIFS